MDSKKECDIDLGYMECENHATGRKNGRGGWRDFMEGRRRRGRPRKRWLHDLEEDLRVMKVGRWWEKVRSKEEWRRIVRVAKAHPGL
jgi:hypothetical protein